MGKGGCTREERGNLTQPDLCRMKLTKSERKLEKTETAKTLEKLTQPFS